MKVIWTNDKKPTCALKMIKRSECFVAHDNLFVAGASGCKNSNKREVTNLNTGSSRLMDDDTIVVPVRAIITVEYPDD